jgi:hypothetical protein
VSTPNADAVLAIAAANGVPARRVGRVESPFQPLRIIAGDRTIDAALAGLVDAYHESIPRIMSRVATATGATENATPSTTT